MMWRCKLIISFFVFFALTVNAQKEIDTLFFVRHASSIGKLKWAEGVSFDYSDFARDSVSFFKAALGKTLYITKSGTRNPHDNPKSYDAGYYKYKIDEEGRPGEFSFWGDSSLQYGYQYMYRINNRPERIIYRHGHTSDTTNYGYDRSGNLGSVCTRDSCVQYLYDNQKRLLVMRNVRYGTIKGDFTYEYNTEGKLMRRRFLESQSGIVLCTDTIEYKYEDNASRYLSKKHSIHIAGREGWIAIDEQRWDMNLRRVISYEIFHGISAPENYTYSYANPGKLNSMKIVRPDNSTEWTYAYSANSDTIRQYKIIEEKEAVRRILWTETVVKYNESGLIAARTEKIYRIRKVKRKWQVTLEEEKLDAYKWN